jgi:hypothetical protein
MKLRVYDLEQLTIPNVRCDWYETRRSMDVKTEETQTGISFLLMF